ncbi:phytanoyl-CoA dioxygenase family protein [Qaidamihabitans albus]|uniref:phytanoyl-CoA dioxygenase family protein n=1 Tax=Qaidamihabitans albus TaxID=2795733 RepID=UPI0018F21885|nr:phytanoyl-CoA dioxygenase family protein [Qaidamihabitans albus]
MNDTRNILTDEQVERFVDDGFVRLAGAFPRRVADECAEILWRETGFDPEDRATWTSPVVRIGERTDEPFRRATTSPALHDAFDLLVGEGQWLPRASLGTFPIRFPHPDDPGDAGWHTDGGYQVPGESWPRLNIRSRGRALLMLFLFSDVGPHDAPTRIKVGSHLDVPEFLAPAGEEGMSVLALAEAMAEAGKLDSPDRPLALATGRAGDVYLCHPFLVHGAQAHRGEVPRLMAQPPLQSAGRLEPDRPGTAHSPVERAIRRGLGLDHARECLHEF